MTTLFPDDAAERKGIVDAFDRMSATLVAGIGEPTARVDGAFPELRWAGAENTLWLTNLSAMVHLDLAITEWLVGLAD